MEQNQFDLLDEVEKDIEVKPEGKPELKEYEKLLLAERNRNDFEKAKNLIKFGCFEQKQETSFDFADLEIIPLKKKYKGLYQLYRNTDTMQLMFVCPLVEDNKGDAGERRDLKPYGYDVIYLEVMDSETYHMVSKAAKNNIRNAVSVAYKTSIVLYFVHIAITVAYFIYNIFAQLSSGFVTALFSAFFYSATYFLGILIATPLLFLIMIKYKKYKAE